MEYKVRGKQRGRKSGKVEWDFEQNKKLKVSRTPE
jgi:hypothetical protein